jgi:hypothetical protein
MIRLWVFKLIGGPPLLTLVAGQCGDGTLQDVPASWASFFPCWRVAFGQDGTHSNREGLAVSLPRSPGRATGIGAPFGV